MSDKDEILKKVDNSGIKRWFALRDKKLFEQPESSHLGDCPICFLPMPLDPSKGTSMMCCSKWLCVGCAYTNEMVQGIGKSCKCPFCRKECAASNEEILKDLKKRADINNDPFALREMGLEYLHNGDMKKAVEYFERACEQGDVAAHYNLALRYKFGEVYERDEDCERYHLEEAAIGGHAIARHNLGCNEGALGCIDKAVKHWIICAKMGFEPSLETLKTCYKDGYVSKEDFAAALRGCQAAVDATKSEQRDKMEKFHSLRFEDS